MARYDDILATIGDTPLVRLDRLAPSGVHLYAKVEAFNPMGSVKDRMALAVIEAAERSGALRPGQTVVEATSGNTGIGLAMVCARKGYPLVVVMAENFSVERRRLLRFLGARVVLTPASEKGTGMLAKAIELAETHGWFLCRQFENAANAEVHEQTTAREILRDLAGEPLQAWVTGFGTGGTLKGVATALRRESPGTRVVVAEPDNAPLLGSGIPQPATSAAGVYSSHPSFRPHLMQGWSPDFVSPLVQAAVAEGLVDEVVPVSGAEAMRLTRQLACREGILAGTSGGATLAAALAVARRAPAGSHIVCMLPDTGERYLSTPLFADIPETMTEEELALSRSTPGFRFDAPADVPAPAPAPAAAATDVEAERFVAETVAREPVVMFALEWCEFCWSVRRLLAALGIPYHSVDLDSVPFQENDLGSRIRPVLAARCGARTIPQVFVGGELVGGCTEVFDAYRDGSLQTRLAAAGVPFEAGVALDPQSLLPGWLQPRMRA
ncbi:pyridoxal-phosphate dependent enzyme [Spiribacter halobius]|uniref:Cysteine synthase B n=1 Tax=Sediminicurvatus halobius TaxID=2182432 RepID=A0A2U2N5J7_9GAMM|nr:pyridoxal-phosphate dependent enzyme [Spiribacter halobius]PWG64363.1 O-acetylserine lyase [Spiribacter halobius]UEX79289.1 pyridoxal-phosphate dependent enzyme [Spiribacter halobius]